MNNRRGFLKSFGFLAPLAIAVPTIASDSSRFDGPRMIGIPVCDCGLYMIEIHDNDSPIRQAYCTNISCRFFNVEYKISGMPMERA